MDRQVVFAEDDDVFRRLIARNLAQRGVAVREARTAAEAVAAVIERRPDLLLLDLDLPDRSGWDVLRELAARGIQVKTIVTSAIRVNPSRRREFQPLAYLPKPFPIEALLRLVTGSVPPNA